MSETKLSSPFYLNIGIYKDGKITGIYDKKFVGSCHIDEAIKMRGKIAKYASENNWDEWWWNPENYKTVKINSFEFLEDGK